MGSPSEQVIIIESNNTSFDTNRLSSFKVRLQHDLVLRGDHEVALTDISLPYTAHNVKSGDYFAIARFARKKTVGNKLRYSKMKQSIHGTDHYLEYCVKANIPSGYYGTVDQLITAITDHCADVQNQPHLKVTDREIRNPESIEGLNLHGRTLMSAFRAGDYWFGNVSAEADNVETLLGLERLAFHSESKKVFIKSDIRGSNYSRFYTAFFMSPNIAKVLGYSATSILLSNKLRELAFAPYMARIIPHDTVYIYTSVIRNVLVSNYNVKLLRAVSIAHRNPNFGDNIFQEFHNPHFIGLNTSRLSCLDFEIRDMAGELIDFESGPMHVRLTLKVRPCKKPAPTNSIF